MPNIVKVIPKTVEELKSDLAAIGALATATEWTRAAIVYAWTQPGFRPSKEETAAVVFSPKAFAALGFTGLRVPEGVTAARAAWQKAIDMGKATEVKPGDKIVIPDLDWAEIYEGRDTVPSMPQVRKAIERSPELAREYIARNPEVAVQAIKAVPAVADAVVAAMVDDTTLAEQHARVSAHKAHTGVTRDPGRGTPANIPTYEREKELMKAIDIVSKAIADEAAGAYTIDPGSTVLLFILTRELNERATRIIGAQPVIHSEIDAFLASARKED